MIAKPHEVGFVSSWRADSLLVRLAPGITPCVETPSTRAAA